MANNGRGALSRLLEFTGLDWLPIILRENAFFPRSKVTDPIPHDQIAENLQNFDDEVLHDIVVLFEDQVREEDSRRATTEAKATQIIGFSAISMSFIIAFAQFLFSNESLNSPTRLIITILYCLVAVSFLIAIWLAYQALSVSTYQAPETASLFELKKRQRSHFYIERATSLRSSYEHNRNVVNDKVTYLMGAQLWLRNVLFLLAILILVLAISSFLASPTIGANTSSPSLQPTPTSTVSPSGTGPADSSNPTSSGVVTPLPSSHP